MKCIVIDFQKVDRSENGQLPYYIVRAKGQQGDENAQAIVNGVINFAAVQSRTFNFTKCLFPGTESQCEQLEQTIELGVTVIHLELFQWEPGKKFYIYDKNGELLMETVQRDVSKVADRPMTVNGRALKKGDTYTVIEDVEQPKIFTKISLTLFCDETGKITEGDGNAEAIARRNWETGLANGVYEIVE